MNFEVVGPLYGVESMAVGSSVRCLPRLRRAYGLGRWRKLKGLAKIKWEDGTIATAELHWYEAHGIRPKRDEACSMVDRNRSMTQSGRRHFVICVSNEGYPASLELRKIYEQLPDPRSEEKGLIRIAADEDDDEALFPVRFFLPIELTREIEKAVYSLVEPEPAHRPF